MDGVHKPFCGDPASAEFSHTTPSSSPGSASSSSTIRRERVRPYERALAIEPEGPAANEIRQALHELRRRAPAP